jgi:hypothetical protein
VGTAIAPVDVSNRVGGGEQPYTFSATAGFPAGVSIDPVTGLISGAPFATHAGGAATVTVTDSAGASEVISGTFGAATIPVVPLAFTHNPAFDIPESTVGEAIVPIDVSLGASGGTMPLY